MTLVMATRAPKEMRSAAQPMPAPSQRRGQRRLGAASLLGRQRADGADRDEDVEHRRDDERADDRDRQVPLGLLRLLAAGGDRVEADVGEEDHRGARPPRR